MDKMFIDAIMQARVGMLKMATETKLTLITSVMCFLYAWQLTGCIHIIGHWLAASFFCIPAQITLPWQRFVPLWGWGWNLTQPHSVMICKYDKDALREASPTARTFIGFAGPYIQLIFIITMGTIILPCVSELCGGVVSFCLSMCVWQLLYFVWYAIHFHNDEDSDFHLFIAAV